MKPVVHISWCRSYSRCHWVTVFLVALWCLLPWAPAGMGKGGTCPLRLEMLKSVFATIVVWNLSRRNIYAPSPGSCLWSLLGNFRLSDPLTAHSWKNPMFTVTPAWRCRRFFSMSQFCFVILGSRSAGSLWDSVTVCLLDILCGRWSLYLRQFAGICR